jgi:hypothetical protein
LGPGAGQIEMELFAMLAFSVAPLAPQAQVDFKIDDRDVQVHGFSDSSSGMPWHLNGGKHPMKPFGG